MNAVSVNEVGEKSLTCVIGCGVRLPCTNVSGSCHPPLSARVLPGYREAIHEVVLAPLGYLRLHFGACREHL